MSRRQRLEGTIYTLRENAARMQSQGKPVSAARMLKMASGFEARLKELDR